MADIQNEIPDEAERARIAGRDEASELVPLAHVPDAISAHLLCEVLETAEIRAMVLGEHAAATFSAMAVSLGVSVHVDRRDYERAMNALSERLAESEAEGQQAGGRCPFCRYDLSGLGKATRCPECGGQFAQWASLRRTIAMAPPPGAASSVQMVGAMMGWIVVGAVVVIVGAAVMSVVMRR